MTYKEALLKHLFELIDQAKDMRMKAMFVVLRRQLEAISEEQAQQIVITAAKIIKKIEADITNNHKNANDKISPSARK